MVGEMTEKRTAKNLAEWQGYLSLAEVEAMKSLVKKLLPNSIIVKIGAGAGTDTLAILEQRQDVVIFSIDIQCCQKPTTTNEHLRLQETDWNDTGHVIRIWGDSKVVGKRWPIPIDFIFIDGDHSEAGKRGDIAAWLPHMPHDSIMAFHNYDCPKWPAVKPVVDEMMQKYDCILHVDTLIAFRIMDPLTDLFSDCESISEGEYRFMAMSSP